MIYKGRISKINRQNNSAEIEILEFTEVITPLIPFYSEKKSSTVNVGDFVLVVVFSNNFNDAIIL